MSEMNIQDIVKGGDERISLNENGLNKYHGNPLIYEGVLIEVLAQCPT